MILRHGDSVADFHLLIAQANERLSDRANLGYTQYAPGAPNLVRHVNVGLGDLKV